MKLKRAAYTVFLLLLCLCLSGCFEYEERIVLNRDGSGTMEIEYWTLGDMEIETNDHVFPHMEKDIRKEIKKKYTSDKIRLLDLSVDNKKDSRSVRFKLAFDNLMDLNEVEQFQDSRIIFKKTGDRILFERDIFLDGDKPDKHGNLFGRLVVGILETALSNIRFRFEIETPYNITKSNADLTPDKNRAVWKYRLSDVMHQEKVEMHLTTE